MGPFTAGGAVPWDADATTAHARMLPPAAAVAGLPRVTLSSESITRLRHGQSVSQSGAVTANVETAVFDTAGNLAAIAGFDGESLRPAKVFPA